MENKKRFSIVAFLILLDKKRSKAFLRLKPRDWFTLSGACFLLALFIGILTWITPLSSSIFYIALTTVMLLFMYAAIKEIGERNRKRVPAETPAT